MTGIASVELKIGMEIHVELATRSKMFSRAPNVAHPDSYDAAPNALVDAVVAGLPGALPVMNGRAIELAMMVGLALGGEIARVSHWDRKNYFYPDLPKGYQISQNEHPLCTGGMVRFLTELGETRRVRLIRAHLEEDAGKLGHELPGGGRCDGTLVDLNRAGAPLLEIVTEPDLASAADAVTFAKELRNICRFLGVTEGIMQRGHLRFEPNINLIIRLDTGDALATPIVEVKNLNSFRALHGAIEYEATRQLEHWQRTGETMGPGMKSTRGWDDSRGETFLQRAKEDAHDYRYFPDPDLPPVVIDATWREAVRREIPELPAQRRARYARDFALTQRDAWRLTEERPRCEFFEQTVREAQRLVPDGGYVAALGGAAASLLLNTGAKIANERGGDIADLRITPRQAAEILILRERDEIGSSAAERLFAMLCEDEAETRSVRDLAEVHGLLQVKDDAQLDAWIETAIEAEPGSASDFAAGKDAAAGRLIGAVMKQSGGRADARAVRAKLIERLRTG